MMIKILRWGLILVMVLMPFHALLTTWLGSNFGNLLAVRAWKEVVLAGLVLIGLWLYVSDGRLRSVVWGRTINKLILAYSLWHIFVAILISRDGEALSHGLAINLRFLIIFVLMQIVVFYKLITRDMLLKIVLIPSVAVVVFGLMQIFVLPKTFLQWFGYDKYQTIPPFFTIDEQLDALRYSSTISGPNTLGAYLVLPIVLAVSKMQNAIRNRRFKELVAYCSLLFAGLIVLYSSHSRSAWLAVLVATAVYVLFRIPNKLRVGLITLGLFTILVSGVLVQQYKNTQFVKDVILHDDPSEGGAVSSNFGHIDALKSGLSDVGRKPIFGCGVGCAGPASVRHEDGAKISENYYIQVTQETGVVGGLLFVSIILLVASELYKKRKDNLALAMLASLVGLSVANLLLHTWADDTLAYIWWGSLAVILYSKTVASKSELNRI
jgi:O-antigen ligase